MACRPEVTGRRAAAPDDAADAYTIEEFCRRHRISVQVFYKYRSSMPVTFTVGTRRLISKEAAFEWRRAREAATESTTT